MNSPLTVKPRSQTGIGFKSSIDNALATAAGSNNIGSCDTFMWCMYCFVSNIESSSSGGMSIHWSCMQTTAVSVSPMSLMECLLTIRHTWFALGSQ